MFSKGKLMKGGLLSKPSLMTPEGIDIDIMDVYYHYLLLLLLLLLFLFFMIPLVPLLTLSFLSSAVFGIACPVASVPGAAGL